MLSTRSFNTLLAKKWREKKFVCVGLDSDYSQLPLSVKKNSSPYKAILNFNRQIVDAVSDLVCAYKIQVSFYEAQGMDGLKALQETISYIQKNYSAIPVILDAKRGDIENSNTGYTKAIFENLGVDAVTVNPYLGEEALKPFLDYKDKGIIVLVKTSNPGGGEFQDLKVGPKNRPLYLLIAQRVADFWDKNGNCGVVVGATYPQQLKEVRKIIGDIPILIPGIGSQGAELKTTIEAGQNSRGLGIIINSSRSIIFACANKDFAKYAKIATKSLDQQIKSYLKTDGH